jgi:phosphoglycerate dehydrogenase-like enzyme
MRMRRNALLINTAGAPIVNEQALITALQTKQIAGAGLDFFDIEPLPPHHALRTLPNVLATPHIGYVTQENYRTIFNQTVENIAAFLQKVPLRELTSSTIARRSF